LRRQAAAEPDAGQRAGEQGGEQRPVDAAQPPVAEAGDQRQRHGVGDVGADHTRRSELGVQEQQGGDAQRARADRRDRNQHAEDGAGRDGGGGMFAHGQLLTQRQQAAAVDQGGGGEQQGDA